MNATAYHEGLAARAAGSPVAANPYLRDTPSGFAWESGWSAANDATVAKVGDVVDFKSRDWTLRGVVMGVNRDGRLTVFACGSNHVVGASQIVASPAKAA